MDELRSFERTPVTNSKALFWEYASGGRRTYWFWNEEASRLVLEAGWANNAAEAARAYALANIAGFDSHIACWDAKYTYWAIRPFQLDSTFTPLFTTPNHPGYPSAHSCISTAVADVLAYLFPADAEHEMALAEEAAESRIWAGIHFRSDVEAGSVLGKAVGDAVIARAMSDGHSLARMVADGKEPGPPSYSPSGGVGYH
jgi:membrane-associated phospholipid phosphatase